MFVYFLNYFNWEDSEYRPIFHNDKLDKKTFNNYCSSASDTAIKNILGHNENIGLSNAPISKYDFMDELVKVLCDEYGFMVYGVLGYDIEDDNVKEYLKL